MREPCAEPVTGGNDENRHATGEGSNPGGGERGQGKRAGPSREEEAEASAPGSTTEPMEGTAPGAGTPDEGTRNRGGEPPPKITWNTFPKTRTKRQKSQQSHAREGKTRPDRNMNREHVEVVCEESTSMSGWPWVGASGSARRVVPFPNAPKPPPG